MQDMLVRLYDLPPLQSVVARAERRGVCVRRCMPYELHVLQHWIESYFSPKWVSEATVAVCHRPPGCFIATFNSTIVGFVCVDATMRGFVGPMGVAPVWQGSGVGAALLLTALYEMRTLGYAYAIIGGVGPVDFYRKVANATPISNSSPGIYRDLLPEPQSPVTYPDACRATPPC